MQLKNQDIASFLGILLMHVVSFEKVFINNRDHSFSTNAKFSEKLIFLTLWNSHICLSFRLQEMLISQKFFRTYEIDDLMWGSDVLKIFNLYFC